MYMRLKGILDKLVGRNQRHLRLGRRTLAWEFVPGLGQLLQVCDLSIKTADGMLPAIALCDFMSGFFKSAESQG